MPDLNQFLDRYRENRRVTLTLWCTIGLGIVPAIIVENISPFNFFGTAFGVEITAASYLPGWVCLLVFLLAGAVCIAKKKYWLIGLLLPWLMLAF